MAHKKKPHMKHGQDETSKERHTMKEPMGKEKGHSSLKPMKHKGMRGK
jgi:hypothetical protein